MHLTVNDIQTTAAIHNVEADGESLEFTILMPCLNEAETISTCVRKALSSINRLGLAAEVLIADNGSTDGSQDLASAEGARVIHVPVRGYGAAIHYGSLAAKGKYVIVGDADDSYDFEAIDVFVEGLRRGADLVMGNRFRGGIADGAMPWKNRYVGNPILTGIGRVFFRCPSSDFHCGLRGYSTEAYRRLDLRTTGMEFASEMVIKATLLGMTITEVPTTLRPDGRSRPPHLRPWRDGWRHLVFMLLYSPRWLFLIPGGLLMTLGALGLAWLWGAPRPLFGVAVLDVHSMVYMAMAILVGYQMVIFALMSKIFAVNEGLLPPDPRLNKAFRYIRLETGLLVGFALVVAGSVGAVAAVSSWQSQSFGPLDPQRVMRLVIPTAVAVTLGVQTILASFFFSVLGLKRRHMVGANER